MSTTTRTTATRTSEGPDATAARRRLLRGKTLALTTHRRDGSTVTTPVWFHEEADGALVVTGLRTAHRHGRIQRDARVAVAPCTSRGRVTGPTLTGTAEVLGAGELAAALAAKRRRYPMFRVLLRLRPAMRDQGAVRIRLDG